MSEASRDLMRNRLQDAQHTPPCTRCGKHALVRSVRQNLLERCARAAWLNPYRCEECGHRFLAVTWKSSHLEWDGHILVMPGIDRASGSGSEGAGEFYQLAVIVSLLVILVVAGIVWVSQHLPNQLSFIKDLQKEIILQPQEPEKIQ